jgi:hypothetical protein
MITTEYQRNTGTDLDLGWVRDTHVNPSAARRRAATLGGRRTVKKQWQAAWLLRAITCIDLTTLSGDDTPGNVARLCAKARHPVRQDVLNALGVAELNFKVGAVCVYHARVEDAVRHLVGAGIPKLSYRRTQTPAVFSNRRRSPPAIHPQSTNLPWSTPAAKSAPTSSCNKSAKGEWEWCTGLNKPTPSGGRSH